MKFVLVGPVYPYRGGISHYTSQLALALRTQGHQCSVISFKRQYPAWLYPGGSDKDPSQAAVQLQADFLLDPFNPITWEATVKQIIKSAPDLIVLQWWTTYWALPFGCLARRLRKHGMLVIYLIHNILPHEEKLWDRSLVKLALSGGQGFVVQTQREKERLLSLFPRAVYQVSAHPVYSMLASRRVDKNQARRILGLPQDKPVLLFFGIVRQYKGLKYLIDALSILKSQGVVPTLLVAGDFWHERKLYEEQIRADGLSDQIRLDDRYIPDEDAALMFSAADVLVAPYVGGTQSGVAGLAQGFGLPIIVTDLVAAGLGTHIRGQEWIVPPADAEALASTIRKCLTQLNQATGEKIPVEDNWSTMVQKLVVLYDQLRGGI